MTLEKEPTLNDVLEAINKASNENEERMVEIEKEIKTMRSEMVTKEYLDEKMKDGKAEIMKVMNAEDEKLRTVVHKLADKNIFTKQEEQQIAAMPPFAQTIA